MSGYSSAIGSFTLIISSLAINWMSGRMAPTFRYFHSKTTVLTSGMLHHHFVSMSNELANQQEYSQTISIILISFGIPIFIRLWF